MNSRKFPMLTLVYVPALLLALALVGVGIWRAVTVSEWATLAVGWASVVLVLTTWPLAIFISHIGDDTREASRAGAQGIGERLDQVASLLTRVTEQQLLSDRAKSVAYRDKDRDAMRRAIQEEINRGDWDAALRLADDIEAAFGYKTEAARVRDEVFQRRQEVVRRQIQEVVTVIDRHTRSEQWNGALREAERLMSMFPDNEQVRNLPNEIDRRRQEHKKQLVDSWHDAVARHDVDGSIEILKQLDAYLTPAEAEGLQETARGVFKEKLVQLSKQFSDAVRDHKWTEAVRVGEAISRDFPNTRVAQEVREKMDTLRQRASEPQPPAVVPAPAPV